MLIALSLYIIHLKCHNIKSTQIIPARFFHGLKICFVFRFGGDARSILHINRLRIRSCGTAYAVPQLLYIIHLSALRGCLPIFLRGKFLNGAQNLR